MSPRIFLSSILLVSASSLWASEAAAPVEAYVPKKHSSFTIPESSRAPFWPIGWTPQHEVHAIVELPKVTLNPEMFAVTSILLGNPSMAVINGRAYSEGDALRSPRSAKGEPRVAAPGLPPGVRIFVQRIIDGRVVLRADAQTVTVMLRRPELNEHKPDNDEQLLSLEDR